LAAAGRKVAIIDIDPQGNASTSFGLGVEDRSLTTADIIFDQTRVLEVLVETQVPDLFIAPASGDLSSADVDLGSASDSLMRLKVSLKSLSGTFDYILIDCPPSLNLLTLNALTASDALLIPLQTEFFALEGLSQLMTTFNEVRTALNPQLVLEGIVLTMFDKRNNLSLQVADDARATLGDKVFETMIPRNVRLSEAPSHAMPALLYDHLSSGSIAYQALAAELLARTAPNQEVR
jgi:chromosome partitioning protein